MKRWPIHGSNSDRDEDMLLEIDNLRTHYATEKGVVKAIDGISLGVRENEVFGLAGESGCGKSTLIRTITRLLPPSARVFADGLKFKSLDLLSLSEREFRNRILWQGISLVPQSAMNALNPVYRVGDQIVEAIQTHRDYDTPKCLQTAEELFELVGLESSLLKSYPHEFSGGMRQRAMIAMSLVLGPDLIIMDEPTTGLDVLVQERILRKLREIRRIWMEKSRAAASILLITHDISVIAEMSDHIGIMYAGLLMESAESEALFSEPFHPYTLGLKNAFPSIHAPERELISIPGSPPNLVEEIPGCPFAPRCPFAVAECLDARPEFREVKPDHFVACTQTHRMEEIRRLAGEKKTWQSLKSST